MDAEIKRLVESIRQSVGPKRLHHPPPPPRVKPYDAEIREREDFARRLWQDIEERDKRLNLREWQAHKAESWYERGLERDLHWARTGEVRWGK